MAFLKRLLSIMWDLFFRRQTPLEKWAEKIEMEAYERGKLDL